MAVVITEESAACLPNLQPLWHRKASRLLVETCPAEDPFGGWTVWQKYLHKRKKPAAPTFLAQKKSPLLWGWPRDWGRKALKRAIRSPTTIAEIVIGEEPAAADLPATLQSVALAYALPSLAQELPAEAWWRLLDRLHEVVALARIQRVDGLANPRDLLRHQLLTGELPLALSYLFPEVRAIRTLRNEARTSLTEAIIEFTNGQGLPDARLLSVLGPLFACWTRSRWLGARLHGGSWSPEAELQFRWLVRQAIRLADKDGRFLLTTLDTVGAEGARSIDKSWDGKLFKTALQLSGDSGDRAAATAALPRSALPKECKCDTPDSPAPSLNSDWAGISIMADGWSQSDARLAVAYAQHPMTVELSAAGHRLLAGAWTFETSCDGKPAQPLGEWEQLCWESGKRFDFLELGLELSEGLRLERQLLFARDDLVLYIADIVSCRDRTAHRVRHSYGLPLAQDAHWQPEAETRDGVIAGRKRRAAVLPLALCEWRSDPRGGSLSESAGRLTLTQESNARALCCPLLFDLERRRAKQERTWRQLTVGENLQEVSRDTAVGFRAQSGRDQWLFYRSLGPAGNRTVLGQNIAGEFCAGPFFPSGKFKEWTEIEAV